MTRQKIFAAIADIKVALKPSHPDAATINDQPTIAAKEEYLKICRRFYPMKEDGEFIAPKDASSIIKAVQASSSKSATLRKYARAVRYLAMQMLNRYRLKVDAAQRKGDWAQVEKMLNHRSLEAIKVLAKTLPAEYKSNGWKPTGKRAGKKSSLNKLPEDWREQVANASAGQFRLATLVSIMTGCRPSEIEKGITLTLINGQVLVHIKGAKVTAKSGQPERDFTLADHLVTNLIIDEINARTNDGYLEVKVKNGNSVTTHIRGIGKKLWPKRKSTICCYSFRHAMAADCKYAIKYQGADKDLVSKVLGHLVDETKSYYGNYSQAKGRSVVPTNVLTPLPIKQKAVKRNRSVRPLAKSKKPKIDHD